VPTPQQATRKWASRLKGAQTEIREGVQSTQKNPMELAAAAQDKWINRLQEAANSGKFAARLRAVPLEKWRSNTVEIGIPRISAGVDAAQGDMEEFFSQLLPFQESLSAQVDSMPDTTLDDSINRMTAWVRGMSEFQRR
jgi:hypothetical protein